MDRMSNPMPLYEMSPNVQEPDSTRKRSHDEYSNDIIKTEMSHGDKTPSKATVRPSGDSLLPPASQNLINSSPQGSPALTEAGSSTPAQNSPSPRTPTKLAPASDTNCSATKDDKSATGKPPAKRKKLTPAEREAREKEMAERKLEKERELEEKKKKREEQLQQQQAKKIKLEEEQAEKKKEREEKLQQQQAKKAKLDEEKAARQKERDEKRKKKEEEDQAKAEQREEKKRQKEEEQQRIQEEKDKKARSQKTLNNFFMMPKTPKKTEDTARRSASPSKPGAEKEEQQEQEQESEYSKIFKPFYIRDNTRVAPIIPNLDDDARNLKSQIVDECIAGSRDGSIQFDPIPLFSLSNKPSRRGRLHPSVKQIMETTYRELEAAGNTSNSTAMDVARNKLRNIPFKVIAFSQDVRPPYFGTITARQQTLGRAAVYKQGRCSAKPLLSLEYDYDSEAEWQEEEGEDIDVDDDEEELDDEDDMDEFLDDSEDAGLSRRIFGTTMEPECTGICFENEQKKTHSFTTSEHKMEIILDAPDIREGIDPFSTSYWEPEPKVTKSTQTATTTAQMPPPPAPANAFAALTGSNAPDGEPLKIVKKELLNDVKKAILDNKALSKVGIIDYIFQQFRDSASKTEVKNTLELVAEKKKGSGRAKEWDLKPGHEISL